MVGRRRKFFVLYRLYNGHMAGHCFGHFYFNKNVRPIFSETAKCHYDASNRITAPLVSIIVLQRHTLPDDNEIKNIKDRRHKTTRGNSNVQS